MSEYVKYPDTTLQLNCVSIFFYYLSSSNKRRQYASRTVAG